jgi:hypothetical protein
MKEFRLKEILLLSLKERRSKRIEFHPNMTVIIGGNGTGKSVLLKSIYHTFGALPHKVHPDWLEGQPTVLIHFTVDDLAYSIMRSGKIFALFAPDGKMLGRYSRISTIGNALADIFGFELELPDRSGKPIIPPPGYLFLPFYMDQDNSWQHNWASFKELYLGGPRLDYVNYHTGIRPNRYYRAKNELGMVLDGIQVISKEIKLIRTLLKNLKQKLAEAEFTISLETFQEETKALVVSCQELKVQQETYKKKLSALYNSKIHLESQLLIVRKALSETHQDYEFATKVLQDVVFCPSCGAEYENSFAERFSIAQDEQRCLELIMELEAELSDDMEKIERLNQDFIRNTAALSTVEAQMEQKKGEVRLRDVIESEGKKEIKALFAKEVAEYDRVLGEKILLRDSLETTLAEIEDKKRTELIRNKYRGYMRTFLDELNLKSVKNKTFAKIDAKLTESGSKTPRELMAYYYSILHVMREYSSSTYCPIIIDSPNQQAQDSKNLPLLLNFIVKRQPIDSQLILSIEEDHGIRYDGKVIRLSGETLLDENDYQDDLNRMIPYLSEVFGQQLFY